jgi:nucleoside-diphosphate-sugar epimerase
MRILVSGGAGFIGSHLVDRLLERNDVEELTVVDNVWTGRWSNLAHLNDDRLKRVELPVEELKSEVPFGEIYHLASPASPNWYMADPRRTISANLMGASNLLDLLEPGGRFCFTSTSEVYGDPLVSPQPESYRGSVDCTGPRSAYDESKRCTEALLFEMARTQNTDIRVARLFNVYGPRVRPEDGRAISNFLNQALAGKPLTVYGTGEQSRSWGYVDDIIDGLRRFFWTENAAGYRGPLNIGNDREVSVLQTAKYVSSLVPGSTIEFHPPVPQDPTNRRPDLTLANKVIPGWGCKVPYEEGIRRTLEWYRSNPG